MRRSSKVQLHCSAVCNLCSTFVFELGAYCMNRNSGVPVRSCTICGLFSAYAAEPRPKLQFIQDVCNWTVLCTPNHWAQTQCNYKCTASYGAAAQHDRACTAKVVVGGPALFRLSHPYTYLCGHYCFTILILQIIASNDSTMTINAILSIHTTLYALNIQ